MKAYLLFAIMFSSSAFANNVKIFVSLTPAGSFEAISKKLKGNLIRKDGGFSADKLWVSIESFKTGIDLRDEHFWKHLNSTISPKIVMTNVVGHGGKATGTLEVNGVKRPVNMTYIEKSTDLTTTFNVKASEFGLKKVSYLGVGVEDSIKIEATYPLSRQF